MSEEDPFEKEWDGNPVQDELEQLQEKLERTEAELRVLESARDDYRKIESLISADDAVIGYESPGRRFQLILTYHLPTGCE